MFTIILAIQSGTSTYTCSRQNVVVCRYYVAVLYSVTAVPFQQLVAFDFMLDPFYLFDAHNAVIFA